MKFPGSNCDLDVVHVLREVLNVDVDLFWHKRGGLSKDFHAAILPGGFSYGDCLRAGVISAYSPVIEEVRDMAMDGKPILGICNGFQILVEAGLLPGALLRNSSLRFVCRWVKLRVENTSTAFTSLFRKGSLVRMPIAHNEGRYFAESTELKELRRRERVVLTYVDDKGRTRPTQDVNPNGSIANIAGICNEDGNVVGLMPHPERASEELLSPLGSSEGILVFKSLLDWTGRR